MVVVSPEKPFWFSTNRGKNPLSRSLIVELRPRQPQSNTLGQDLIGDESSCIPKEVIDERIRKRQELTAKRGVIVVDVTKMSDREFGFYLSQLLGNTPKPRIVRIPQSRFGLFEELAGPIKFPTGRTE